MTSFPWKAVAWDIDGTLVDSEPLHEQALLATCDEYGVDVRHLDRRLFVGVHLPDVWSMLRADLAHLLEETAFCRSVNRHYVAGAPGLRPLPGAIEVVRELDRLGVVQVCASNSGREVVDTNLAQIGLAGLMRGTVSLDDVAQGKPQPEPYLRAAGIAGADPAGMLAVEDSLTGVRAAKAAGMRVAFLDHSGEGVAAGADYILRDLTEILSLTYRAPQVSDSR